MIDRITPDGLDTLATFIDVEEQPLPELDRSTAENYATCPLMAWLVDHRRILNATAATASGQDAHDCLSEATKEWIASRGELNKTELADMLRGYMAQSRPDVQPDVIEGLRRSVWPWCEFITGIHAENILRFDGGDGRQSGQIGKRLEHLGVTATTELDLLYAGPSKEQLHVVDYKTGNDRWKATDVKAAFQFQMQAWLVLENYPDVSSVEVRIWNTRFNQLTYAVEFERSQMYDLEQRVVRAASLAVQYRNAVDASDVPAWPGVEKCRLCRAAHQCHAVPPSDIATNPQGFLLAMHAQQISLDAMQAEAAAYVAANGDITFNGLAFGIAKPKSRKPTPSLYFTGGNDADD